MNNLRIVNPEEEFARLNDEEEESAASAATSEPNFGPIPDPPDFFSFEAKLEWINAAPELHSKGKLHGATRTQFEHYCILVGLAREMNAQVEADFKVLNGRLHPGIRLMREAMKEAQGIYAMLFKRETAAEIERSTEAVADRAQSEWGDGLLAK